MRFRTKTCEIEAIRFNGFNQKEIFEFSGVDFLLEPTNEIINGELILYEKIVIPTLEGNMHLTIGNWLIKGLKGEFYPCRDDIFKEKYEEIK